MENHAPLFDLPKSYEPKAVDSRWLKFWEEKKLFKADPTSSKPPFCISMPPPNVTGSLHMGHALVSTLQDILTRWKRMSGYEALWVPGLDHAGIATQTAVEKHLLKSTGKRRVDFSREEFVKHIWSWKEEYGHTIVAQLKKMGSSCDWTRQAFTMDPSFSLAVKLVFKKLFDQGLIYRGDYLVNWDTVTQTALADDELEYEERKGFLWFFKFPLEDGSGEITVATTRPETMLGDTAVAVSPKDPRYKAFKGKKLLHPLRNTLIPIVEDHFVDVEFGTGAVKITPAHDPNDYELGLRHKLPFINIMTPDGKVNENGSAFAGLTFLEAREDIIAHMKEKGLFVKAEPHTNRIALSYRSKAVIEPYLSKQWFVKMEPFKKSLKEAVSLKKTALVPPSWDATYFHWIDNLRDWCISRQLWWGHQIPIWYNLEDPSVMICHAGEGVPEAVKQAPHLWRQDSDVLDTWFSSALWPFVILGWPESTPDLRKFYPNSTLITGHDILFFWVARMIMMGTHVMEQTPFPETFLHGLIYGKSYWRNQSGGGITYITQEERTAYDKGAPIPADVQFKWEKMSKTKGNVIDPTELIEEYGTDAVRMALAASATKAREIDLDRRKFEEYKNFTNKIWNGARFVFTHLQAHSPEEVSQGLKLDSLRLEDRWILTKLNATIDAVNQHLTAYEFDSAAELAYTFFWKEFCAYYVEFAKPYLYRQEEAAQEATQKKQILLIVLTHALRLLHPMAPFITEELFLPLKQKYGHLTPEVSCDPLTLECLKALSATACAVAPYPQAFTLPFEREAVLTDFATLEQAIYLVRNLRGEMKIPPQVSIELKIHGNLQSNESKLLKANEHLLLSMIKLQSVAFIAEACEEKSVSQVRLGALQFVVPLPLELREAERSRLEKENEKLLASIEKLEKQLMNPDFKSRAPEKLIAQHEESLSQAKQSLQANQQKLESIF